MVAPWVYGGIGGAGVGLILGDSWGDVAVGFAAGTPAGQRGFTWLGRHLVSAARGGAIAASRSPWVLESLHLTGRLGWHVAKRAALPVYLGLEMINLFNDFQSGDPDQLHENKWVTAADWSWNSNPTSEYSGFNRWLDLVGYENPLETHVRY